MNSGDLQARMPKPLIMKLLMFLQANLTGQVVLDIRDGEIKSAKITEAVRMKTSLEEET